MSHAGVDRLSLAVGAQPTPEEIDAAKEELVQEAVDKIMSSVRGRCQGQSVRLATATAALRPARVLWGCGRCPGRQPSIDRARKGTSQGAAELTSPPGLQLALLQPSGWQ